MRPLHPNLRVALAAKDSPVRTLVEAQAERDSPLGFKRTKAQLQSADSFTARSADFTAANSLTAAAQTVEAALTNAPSANALYEPRFKVTINPVVPGAGTNSHKVTVAVETDATGAGSWVEAFRFDYEVVKKVGEPNTAIVWPSERMPVRVTGITNTGKLRLKIAAASGPGGWSFSVHGFNLATDLDATSGVTYHTGPAIDFLDGGGATLADTVLSKISHATTDGYETDLGGPALVPEVAPFIVARLVWGKDDSNDIAIDRFVAQLHPDVDGVPGNKNVVWFVCQPYALLKVQNIPPTNPISLTEYLATLVPLADPVRVPAGDGTTAQDYIFSFSDRSVTGPGHSIVTLSRKPRPKSIKPDLPFGGGLPALEHLNSPTTFWFIWALKADGSPATNVGWARNSAVTEVVNGSRKLRTVQIRRDGQNWAIEGPSAYGATPRPVFRCDVQCGSYAAAELDYTGGNLLDLGAAPTDTVIFTGIAGVPDGCGSTFQVRNDADSAWLTFTDGQTAAEIGVSQRQTYKVRWQGAPNATTDATPTLWEIGVRDVKKVWLSDLISDVRAKWAIPDVAELVPSIPEFEFVFIKNGEHEFNDRITRLLSENYLGTLAFRVWRGDPTRPRAEWMHKDDATLIDDYDPRDADVSVIAHSALIFTKGALPVYDTTLQKRTPLQLANKTPRQAYDEIVGNQLAPDIPARYKGESLFDDSTLISKTIEDSDGLTELNAIEHVAGCALSTSQGKLKSFSMFAPGAVQVLFPSQKIQWRSTSPGLRQRVPRFFVRYNYDPVAGQYGGEARLISGNDILATNLKPSRIDAVTELRDEVARWIPTEILAKQIGQRRVNSLGQGMLVWTFDSTEFHPELELGDVVAVETDRFFARDPSQTTQRTLKGALWAIARVVEHDVEGKSFGVWIQSYSDILGSSDAAVRLGFGPAQPILSITIDFTVAGAAIGTIQCDATAGSIKMVGRKTGFPSLADVQAQPTTNGRNVSLTIVDAATGSAMQMNDGDICYLSAIAYTGLSGGGQEGPLAQGRVSYPYIMRRLILTTGSTFNVPADWNNNRNTIEAIGGGGGGAAGTTNMRGGGGGGGGEYRKIVNVPLTPGAAISYVIGAGGAGGAGSGSDGTDGGDTNFNAGALLAKKGLKGVAATSAGGVGGTGGTGAGGNNNGGTGANGTVSTNASGGGGGGAGGTTAVGGNGSGTTQGNGGAANGGTGDGGNGSVWGGSDGAGAGGTGGAPPTPTAGHAGGQWGGAGGGGGCIPATFSAGGAGKTGVLVITWFS